MTKFRGLLVFACATLVASAFGQAAWMTAYEEGLKACKDKRWAEARVAFQKAAAYRAEDFSNPTPLPGPVTERRYWRDGAPYSPNFLAAYAGFKAAAGMQPGEEATNLLKSVAAELEERLTKGQSTRPTYYTLNATYAKLGDNAKREAVVKAFAESGDKFSWRIDADGIQPEDQAEINGMGGAAPGTRPGTGPTTAPTVIPSMIGLPGSVATVPNKFALVIGNSESAMPNAAMANASDNVQLVRSALVSSAGYQESNVDVILNATAEQMMTAAKALADRSSEDSTVLIYFVGNGVNIGGKDFLAGVDASSASDTAHMASKADLYQLFLSKGARVFAFFEANRQINNGLYFGKEVPAFGKVAQVQATSPGDAVGSIYRGSKSVGLFTDAFVSVLSDMRSNRIPIGEFGWQLFYKIRRGNTGTTGGSSRQTPTLPVIVNMASDARF